MSLLNLSKLEKRFGGLVAVNQLSFTLEPGQILGLLGPNGSGKTTVMNLISGAFAPTSGSIRLGDVELSRLRADQIAQRGVARTFQLVKVLPEMTLLENVMAGLVFTGPRLWGQAAEQNALALLQRVGIEHPPHTLSGELTYIDQKRLELARALAARPRLLLLDEWLAGLNPSELQVGIALIRSLKTEVEGIILVEHVMDAIHALCDRCVVMNTGSKIAEGTPSEVLSHPEVVRAYLGDADA
ncbi:MAG: ATP-binding cassette domain-containing protein [Pigmentiphaga sp.]|nr:ATP-binding cassette domain-containing protein [Pigmentiphaga sp.]